MSYSDWRKGRPGPKVSYTAGWLLLSPTLTILHSMVVVSGPYWVMVRGGWQHHQPKWSPTSPLHREATVNERAQLNLNVKSTKKQTEVMRTGLIITYLLGKSHHAQSTYRQTEKQQRPVLAAVAYISTSREAH